MQISRRYLTAFLAIAGTLPWLLLFLEYRLFSLVYSQIGLLRTLGLGAVFSLGAVILAAALALGGARLAERASALRLIRALFFTIALGNLAAVGLAVFYNAPALAPRPVLVVVGLAVVGLMVRFATQPESDQALVMAGLTRLGLVPVALTLVASPAVVWDALTQDRPTAAIAPVPAGAPLAPNAPRHIVLLSFDAWRAQSTSLINPAIETPALAKLAEESTVFTNCRATGDRTLVAMFSTLTGLPPQRTIPHVHNRMGYIRQGEYVGLAGHLKPAGYRGAYFTMIVGPDVFGMLSEYETGRKYAYLWPPNDFNGRDYIPLREVADWIARRVARLPDRDTKRIKHEIPATRDSLRAARAHLVSARDKAFVWVHIGAPHLPYYDVPPEDLDGTLRPQAYRKVDKEDGVGADAANLKRIEKVYEAYVRFVDHELGGFMDGLRRDGRLADTLVIVMADHGEDFAPGHFPHGTGHLTEAMTHVPFLIRLPGQPAARRVEQVVSQLDLVPTVLSRVYRQPPSGFVGKDLLGKAPIGPRTVESWGRYEKYVEEETTGQEIAVYDGRFKYVHDYANDRELLFDLERDPQARQDIASARPADVARLRARVTPDDAP